MYVFSLVFLILLESTFLAGENSSEQKAFRSVFHYAYILFVSQIAWNILDGRIFEGAFIVNYVLCGISAAATTMCSFKWFCYYERLTNPKKNFSLIHNILVLIPLVAFIALIATTFITKWIFYIDDNNFYEKGTQPWLFILTSCFYLILVIICALISIRKKVSIAEKKRYVIVACFSFIPLIAIAYKIFDHTNLSISQLCIVLALTCVYVNIQQQKITRDALSNLNNRFSFEKYLDDVILQYPENREPISLILIDVLNFKKLNDNFGHVEGDILICDIAAKLKKLCSSKKCFLARYSGDTFAIVSIGMLTSEVSDFKETIKKSLEKNDNDKKYEIKVLLSSKSYEMQLKNTKEFIQKTLAQITEDKAKVKTENNAAKLETK